MLMTIALMYSVHKIVASKPVPAQTSNVQSVLGEKAELILE